MTAMGWSQTSEVPGLVSYQGIVADINDNLIAPVTAENHEVIFRVWDNATASGAANLVYSETQLATIFQGQFSVLVGAGADVAGEEAKGPTNVDIADVFDGSERFLGVTVAAAIAPGTVQPSDVEITPRQQIVATAFAFRAKEAETVVNSSIGTAAIANGAITLGKMASNSVNGSQIVDSSITTNDLANGLVTSSKLAGNSVGSAAILDGSILSADLSNSSVTGAKILARIIHRKGSGHCREGR
jgi:hypothetical protein